MPASPGGDRIDLRSDFLSRPTPAMVEAMAKAAGEPCGFRPDEHPLEDELQALAAQMLGKEAALFCVTCAQANQIAINVHCRPGEMMLAERTAHVITSEAGASAALSGVTALALEGRRGIADAAALRSAFEPGDLQKPRTSLLLIENTHVRSGGSVVPLETMRDMAGHARAAGAAVHLDGSRLFNAALALGVSASDLAQCADSVAISLNKGLAAPQGAILAGSHAFIDRARRSRQMMGGGWRPHPVLCAAGIVALKTMPPLLADDHTKARELADALEDCAGITLGEGGPQTNLVLVDLGERCPDAVAAAAMLAEKGVLALPFGPRRLRLAFYHDITGAHLGRIASAIRAVAAI